MRAGIIWAPILATMLAATGPTTGQRLTPANAELTSSVGDCRPETALLVPSGRFHLQCTVVTNATTQKKRLSACQIVRAEPEPARPYPVGVANCLARNVRVGDAVANGPASLAISWHDEANSDHAHWAIDP